VKVGFVLLVDKGNTRIESYKVLMKEIYIEKARLVF
jgi:hypothetical protein